MAEFVISSAIYLFDFLMYEDESLELPEYALLIKKRAAILKGSEEHLQGLTSDLNLMSDFLKEYSGRRSRHHLISQVREMANDAGVIIDTFFFIGSEELESVRLNNFLGEIESIRSRFREVNLQSPVEEEEEHVRRNAPYKGDEDVVRVVGLEKKVEELIQKCDLHGEVRHIVSMIHGMGGIGKTTLARQIYNHAIVVEQFERRAWAFVSSEYNIEEVFRVLIRQVADLTEEKEKVMERMKAKSLRRMLSQHLRGKRYFIVLDDVWDDNCVYEVDAALSRAGLNPGILLVTGRSPDIGVFVDDHWELGHLSSDASWQLFLKTVFICHNKCPKHLEKIGRQIVKKCNGLPLAIKEVGRQLATKGQSESEWEEFLKFDYSETIGSLELSYHTLSPECKSCFLHMSFFQEGTTIRTQRFTHIWNAAGMVTRVDESRRMEVTAKTSIHSLSRECMIMVSDRETFKSFCIDGFLHQISITKAQEEIGFEILGKEQHCPSHSKPRHRAIYFGREKPNYSVNQDKHLLSLFFYGGGSFDTSLSCWESFEQLRILDFEGFGLKSLSGTVCELSRLRYLGLRDNYIQELPNTLGRLKNLEVLDIALNFMIEVPDMIWEMFSLRHLYMSGIVCRTPLKIDSLKYLQTLTYISVDNWAYELSNLEKMNSLRKLGIEELDENSDVSKLFASLAKLKNLECLILKGSRFGSMPPLDGLSNLHCLTTLKLDGRLTMLPKFPPKIEYLILVNSCLDEDPVPQLRLMVPDLRSLVLKNAYTGQEMAIWQHGSMYIRELWHLRNLKLGDNVNGLPSLLDICSCPNLDNIPEEITSFGERNLDELKMVTTRKIAKLIRQSHINAKTYLDIQP